MSSFPGIAPVVLRAADESQVARVSLHGSDVTVRFGTRDVRDLRDPPGSLPCTVWRVQTRQREDGTREVDEDRVANVRTEKQVSRRVREAQSGWCMGWQAHVEIRALTPKATP
jgi:hypothetical protein